MNPIINRILEKDPTSQPWWNRPLWSHKSVLQTILEAFFKPTVPEGVLFIHQREIVRAAEIAKKAEKIDSEKFSSKEFVHFLKIRLNISKGIAGYREIDLSAQLLKAAIEAKDCLTTIWQVEYQYRSFKQQEYYDFIDIYLNLDTGKDEFLQALNFKVNEVLPQLKGDLAQKALKAHQKALATLADNKLGLELLRRFKRHHLADFVVLRTVGDLITQLQTQDLTDFRGVLPKAISNYTVLEKLLPIITCDKEKTTPETLSKILQQVTLEFKHRTSYQLFQQLVTHLEQWHQPYQEVRQIRQTYTADKYKQPKDFVQKVPGSSLYVKYDLWFEEKLSA